MITSRTAASSGMSSLRSGPTCTCANMPRAATARGASRRRISAHVSSGRSFSRSACSRAIFCTDAAVEYQYRAPSEYRYVAWSDSSDSAFAKFPIVSPGVAMPSQMCCRSIPRCAAFSVGAEPRKIARASRLVTFRVPERRAGRVDPGRRGRRAVDVGVDHRLEAVLQVLRDLRQHVVGVQRHPARHDQRRGVVPLPQLVDDRGHQPQHAAGALEPVQRRPVAGTAGRTAPGASGTPT